MKTRKFRKIGNGQMCEDCCFKTIAYERIVIDAEALSKRYFYKRYDHCPRCGKLYMIDSSKVYPPKRETLF